MIALIPCRSGSKRVPKKNFKLLKGQPLWYWTYEAAALSGCFDGIYLCTDPQGAELLGDEPEVVVQHPPLHRDSCCDIEWVTDALKRIIHTTHGGSSVCSPCSLGSYCVPEFAVLRPTSPFRDAQTINKAKAQWDAIKGNYDSMRAIAPTSQHPMKQWSYDPDTHELWALMKAAHHKHMHSRPSQTLGDFYAQTASLEMAHTRTPLELGTIAGDRIAGFLTCGPAALDINTPDQWEYAEHLVSQGKVCP